MSREEILEKLKGIAVIIDESLKDGTSEIGEDTKLLEDLGFSSLNMVFLAVMLEETFSLRINNLGEVKLHTVGDVVDLVEDYSREKQA